MDCLQSDISSDAVMRINTRSIKATSMIRISERGAVFVVRRSAQAGQARP